MATRSSKPSGSDEPRRGTGSVASGPGGRGELDLEVDPAQLDRLARPGHWRLRHLMYLVAIVAVLLWLGIVVAGSVLAVVLMVLGALVLLFVGAMGTGVILAWGSTTKQDALLHILAIAAEREMPLAPAVAAFSDQYRGAEHRRIMNLAARLNGGTALAEALEHSRRVVTRDAVLLAWVGQAAGLLPKALRIAAESRSGQLPIWTNIASRLGYILILILGMQGISGFIMYFVVPNLEAIFRDFGLGLPRVTVMVINAAHFMIKYGYPFTFLPLFELGVLILLPFSFLAWGSYSVPIFDRLLLRRHTALVLRSLSLFVEGGKPILLGLLTLADHYPTYWVRRRLRRSGLDVRGGLGWIEALGRNRVIRASDRDVLASAEAVGNLAWALSELAETAERRLAARFQIAIQTLFPLVIVMLGMVVFILATAYFLPLISLIQKLA